MTSSADLTRGQLDALVAMLGSGWSLDGAVLRSLAMLGLAEAKSFKNVRGRLVACEWRLTVEGKRVAYARLAETRQPGVA